MKKGIYSVSMTLKTNDTRNGEFHALHCMDHDTASRNAEYAKAAGHKNVKMEKE